MKRVNLLLMLFFLMSSFCHGTEYSEFAAKNYAEEYNLDKVHITVKKEHTEELAQEFGQTFFPYIVYGYGDIKGKKCKKKRISYICLLDCKLNPIWSYIIPR